MIIQTHLTIEGTYTLTEDTEIAAGVTVTVAPGGVFDLGGHELLNRGRLELLGTAQVFAELRHGVYSTAETTGVLSADFGRLSEVWVSAFFSDGALVLRRTVVDDSLVDALISTEISDSLFRNSLLDVGLDPALVARVTFLDSAIIGLAWDEPVVPRVMLVDCNFVGDGDLLVLDPFFIGSGASHQIDVVRGYIDLAPGESIDDHVFDANDDPDITLDITPASFLSTPYLNAAGGFTVGPVTITAAQLGMNSPPPSALIGTEGPDELIDTSGLQVIHGLGGADRLQGLAGNDQIDGGDGIDLALYLGNRSGYAVAPNGAGVWTVTDLGSGEGIDTLTQVERLGFIDQRLALDLGRQEHAGETALFLGVMAPSLIQSPTVFGAVLALRDQGQTVAQLFQLSVDLGLVSMLAGSNAPDSVARLAFRNVVGFEPDAAMVDLLAGFMDGRSAQWTPAQFLTTVAGLDLNAAHIGLTGLQSQGVAYA